MSHCGEPNQQRKAEHSGENTFQSLRRVQHAKHADRSDSIERGGDYHEEIVHRGVDAQEGIHHGPDSENLDGLACRRFVALPGNRPEHVRHGDTQHQHGGNCELPRGVDRTVDRARLKQRGDVILGKAEAIGSCVPVVSSGVTRSSKREDRQGQADDEEGQMSSIPHAFDSMCLAPNGNVDRAPANTVSKV